MIFLDIWQEGENCINVGLIAVTNTKILMGGRVAREMRLGKGLRVTAAVVRTESYLHVKSCMNVAMVFS